MKACIAIIDDDHDFLDLMGEVLGDAGFRVVSLRGSDDVITNMVAARPDAIILDLLLASSRSGANGWDWLRLIRSQPSLERIPVLVCSGDVVTLRGHSAEIDGDPRLDALAKPFSIDQLEQALGRLMAVDPIPEWDDERDLVVVADADARLVHASTAMLSLLGLGADAITQCRVGDIVSEDAGWTQREWEHYLAAKRWEGSVTLKTYAGERVPAHARAEIIEGRARTWHVSRISVGSGAGPIDP